MYVCMYVCMYVILDIPCTVVSVQFQVLIQLGFSFIDLLANYARNDLVCTETHLVSLVHTPNIPSTFVW